MSERRDGNGTVKLCNIEFCIFVYDTVVTTTDTPSITFMRFYPLWEVAGNIPFFGQRSIPNGVKVFFIPDLDMKCSNDRTIILVKRKPDFQEDDPGSVIFKSFSTISSRIDCFWVRSTVGSERLQSSSMSVRDIMS